MVLKTVNVGTGPVGISAKVQSALAEPCISHRSAGFERLYNRTTEFLCKEINVLQTFLLTGSGTVANEAMLWQIKNERWQRIDSIQRRIWHQAD